MNREHVQYKAMGTNSHTKHFIQLQMERVWSFKPRVSKRPGKQVTSIQN